MVHALQDVARGRAVLADHLRKALDVLLHLVEHSRIGRAGTAGHGTPCGGRRAGGSGTAGRVGLRGVSRQRGRAGQRQRQRQRHGAAARAEHHVSAHVSAHFSSSKTLRKSSSTAFSSRLFWFVSRVTAWVF